MADQKVIAGAHVSAQTLSIVTVAYNIVEGIVSIGFAVASGSSALLGFGLDSFVESLSGGVMIWRFSDGGRARREALAIRLVGIALIILAAYVAYEAATSLYRAEPPERNIAGLLIAGVSLITMPILYILKQRTAKAINSRSLVADSKQTLACIMLSVALVVGTGLNYLTGFWQADP